MAKKYNLVWVTEDWGDGEYSKYLSTDEHRVIDSDSVEVADEVELDDLIHFCESCAEGDNYHDFVDTPQRLVQIMKNAGIPKGRITKVFCEIAEYGGLHRI